MRTREGFYPVSDFAWPVTLLWRMSVPWGRADLQLTVDVPSLVDDPLATAHLVNAVWDAAVAPATSFLTTLIDGGSYLWKLGNGTTRDNTFPVGRNGIHPLGKEHGIALVMHSGDQDRSSRRRLILPAAPRSWVDSRGQLTATGAGEGLEWARGLYGGLNGSIENAPMTWLTPHADAILDPLTGFRYPGFRRVEYLRLCQYTVPVPDPSP